MIQITTNLMRSLFILIFIYFFTIHLTAQTDSLTLHKPSNTTVLKDASIDRIIDTYHSSFQLTGYRVQIGSESNSHPAKRIRAAFIQKYKEIPAYEVYQQPYFKVRVGDFKTKLEAIKFQKEILSDFPNSFIVKDEIEFKKDNLGSVMK
ncbi:MAG: SPOR domain-containing protein [Vicingaceae bacterium]|nr:SPOR domain-containing protein [Vicingaceae bacterium]